jgi:sec-independent protein translocase protein TatA
MRLQGWEWIIILAIVLLLWGAPKLPALAKSAAQSMRIFKKEINKNGEAEVTKTEASEGEKKQD